MIFHSIKLTDFGSFKGEHKFEFIARKSGLWFLTGDNKLEPRLGANGAGKSTLWNALCWCLYGKTLNGLKAGEIQPWGLNGATSVEVRLTLHDEVVLYITRTQSPNSIKVGGLDTNQSELNKVLGLDYDAFQRSIIIGQKTRMFLDLSPAEKLAMFSDVLGLGLWLDLSEKAAEAAHQIDARKTRVEDGMLQADSALVTMQPQLADLKTKNTGWKVQQRDKESTVKAEIKAVEKDAERIAALAANADKAVAQAKAEHKRAKDSLDIAGEKKADYAGKLRLAERAETEAATNCKQLQKRIDYIPASGSVCNECGQKVDKAHAKQHRAAMDAELAQLNKAASAAVAAGNAAQERYEKASEQYDKLQREERQATHAISAAEFASTQKNGEHAQAMARLKKLEDDLESLGNEKSPYTALIDDLVDRIVHQTEKRKAQELDYKRLSAQYETTSYWIKGFKAVRLLVLESCLRGLEAAVNGNLQQLGLVNWAIEFDVERETKSGSIAKGFTTIINSPHNAKPVPWEAWSGGESQRLQLATTLGLSEMLLDHAGIKTNLLVLDEPTQHLSSEGIDDVLELLSEWATDAERQVWLVDHRSLDYGGFVGTVCVTKGKNGSRIEE